jgi:hypothetical protein
VARRVSIWRDIKGVVVVVVVVEKVVKAVRQ